MKGYNFPANIQLAVNLQTFCLLPFFFQLLCIRKLCSIGRGFWEALKTELVNLDSHTVAKGKEREKTQDFYYSNFPDITSTKIGDHWETKHYHISVFVLVASSLYTSGI